MILLTATRIADHDRFGYSIVVKGREPIITTDHEHAAELLARFGVDHPDHLVRHARSWGRIEIFEHDEVDEEVP